MAGDDGGDDVSLTDYHKKKKNAFKQKERRIVVDEAYLAIDNLVSNYVNILLFLKTVIWVSLQARVNYRKLNDQIKCRKCALMRLLSFSSISEQLFQRFN